MRDVFVARQPIFDADNSVVGHELLYRANLDVGTAGNASASTMSSTVIVDAVLGLGLDLLTEGQKAFINFSTDMLLGGAPELLDPGRVVIEVLEDVEPSPAVVDKLRSLAAAGYTIALDDFVHRTELEPMVDVASIVKVDVQRAGLSLATVAEQLRSRGIRMLAEKVENQDMHETCVSLGFELFQGFHYVAPETLSRSDLKAQSVAIIRLMNLVQDPNAGDRQLEEAFRVDPALTYKLLRIVNSASLGGRGVDSIGHAMRLLGREPLYRWLTLLLMTSEDGDGMRMELIKDALLRARMCEVLGDQIRTARTRDVPAGGALFLVGLFSQADQLLNTTLGQLLEEVDVSSEVRGALLERAGPGGIILKAVEAYAEADWDRAIRDLQTLGGSGEILSDTYLEALGWAADRMRSHQDAAA